MNDTASELLAMRADLAQSNKERDKAKAACAEMQSALLQIAAELDGVQIDDVEAIAMFAKKKAESCSTGWLSPEVKEKVREVLERFACNGNDAERALALLDEKQSK